MTPALNNLPRSTFYAVAPRQSWKEPVECSSIVMLPQGTRLHDSGYRYMDAVACKGEQPLCRVSGLSDVFHFQAPSNIWTGKRTPTISVSWGMDCLKRSGLFRIFLWDLDMQIGGALSSLYIHPILRAAP